VAIEDVHSRLRELLRSFKADACLVRSRGLVLYEDAAELVVAETAPGGRLHLLTPAAADAWRKMKQAAAADGIAIHVVSAFRSFERQAELISAKLQSGQRIDEVLSVVAPPGCSEHHSGRAVDIGTSCCPALEEIFETTPAFAWLTANARRFGFAMSYGRSNPFGFIYEPWHWCCNAAAE